MTKPVSVGSLPGPLDWLVPARRWHLGPDELRIEADAETDWFIDPSGETEPKLNAPALVGSFEGDYVINARVSVEFASTFDAGVLIVYQSPEFWAKLCFEYSPQREPMIVSVVTKGVSDDANAFVTGDRPMWLRVARLGRAFAFHASEDGERWQLIRYFTLGDERTFVGFESQSPTGDGCIATFADIRFEPTRLQDLRSGL